MMCLYAMLMVVAERLSMALLASAESMQLLEIITWEVHET